MTWNEVRLRRLFAVAGGSWGVEPAEGEVEMPCIRAADFDYLRLQTDTGRAPVRGYSVSDARNRAAKPGDLIIEKSGGGEQQPVGRTVLHRERFAVMPTNFAGRLRPSRGDDPRFLCYLMSALYTDGRTTLAIKQTTGIQNLDLGALLDEVVRVPAFTSQCAIADYLDTETAHIDAVISKKRRLVELVGLRLASAVDGRFAFAGESVPTPRLSTMVSIREGQVDPRQEPYASLTLIAPNHVEAGTGRLLALEAAVEQGAISGKYLCGAGDVIYSKIRPALRKVCLAPTRCLTSADMYPLRPLPGLLPTYLYYFLLSERFSDFAILESERVAMPKINRDAFGRIRIPLPSSQRQQDIVDVLDRLRDWAFQSSAILTGQIQLLREHRQALITAAVTGELDIPGVA